MVRWHLKKSPYAVQQEALKRASGRKGYGWWLEPGLGKTTTALNEFLDLHLLDQVDFMVVFAPKNNMDLWKDQAEEFGFTPPVIKWPNVPNIPTPFVWVINYEAVMYGAVSAVLKRAEVDDYYLVADESHWIKNYQSVYAKRLLELRTYARFTRALTGTPRTNTVMDWWPQLRFIYSDMRLPPPVFKKRFAEIGGFMGKAVVGDKNVDELAKIIEACSFTAEKKDWAADLPPKLPAVTVTSSLTKKMMEHYKTMTEELTVYVKETEEVEAKNVVGMLNKLQQISGGFVINTNSGETIRLEDPDNIPKIRDLKQVVESIKGKVIVFTYFNESTRMLKEVFPDAAFMWGTRDPDSQFNMESVKRFNTDDKCKMIVGSTAVASTGLTLLGNTSKVDTTCSTVIFYENSFNMSHRIQAEDRCHRHGQYLPVSYYDIIASEVEKRPILALQKKTDLIKATVDYIKSIGPLAKT